MSETRKDSLATKRLSDYFARSQRRRSTAHEEARQIVPLLAARSYHIPGNSWFDDWVQYMCNNHPFWGICCHHRLHPLKAGARLVILLGSVACGLAITNVIYLWFVRNNEDMDDVTFRITINGNTTSLSNEDKSVDITKGMIVLWTVGSTVHSTFDLTVWYLAACKCCQPGGSLEAVSCFKSAGTYIAVAIVLVTMALASLVVVLRASLSEDELDERQFPVINDDRIDWDEVEVKDKESFSFLLGWLVELVLALFFYYPLVGTVFFSGVLGCGRLPFLGGRPRAVRLQKRKQKTRTSSTVPTERSLSSGCFEGIP